MSSGKRAFSRPLSTSSPAVSTPNNSERHAKRWSPNCSKKAKKKPNTSSKTPSQKPSPRSANTTKRSSKTATKPSPIAKSTISPPSSSWGEPTRSTTKCSIQTSRRFCASKAPLPSPSIRSAWRPMFPCSIRFSGATDSEICALRTKSAARPTSMPCGVRTTPAVPIHSRSISIIISWKANPTPSSKPTGTRATPARARESKPSCTASASISQKAAIWARRTNSSRSNRKTRRSCAPAAKEKRSSFRVWGPAPGRLPPVCAVSATTPKRSPSRREKRWASGENTRPAKNASP